jgi:hypothetical protein
MKFSAIEVGKNEFGAKTFNIVDENNDLVVWEGQAIVVVGHHTAEEIANKMSKGTDVSAFYSDEGDDYYGSPRHAEFGDGWFFNGCEGAW